MATASVLTPATATSSNNLSDEERRWLIIGICLNKVLTPELRKVLGNEIPKWYKTLAHPPTEIDKQTFGKYVKNLPPSTIKLNYDSINNNTVHKSPKLYDYAVKDPLSLAKLLVKPFMAKFTGFDHTMDTSAVLSVICEAQPFIACGSAVHAKKVRSDCRNTWAHCDFSYWNDPNYHSALNDMEFLVKSLGLTAADEKIVLDKIDTWKKNGKKLCFSNPVDGELLNLIRNEVGNLQESISLLNEDSKKDKEKLLSCLNSFQYSLSKEICELRAVTDRLELEQISLHSQYVSTVQDVEKIKIEVNKMATTNEEFRYVFHAPKKNPWFGGRSSELTQLASLLRLDNASQSKVQIAAVCGLGGVGKTSLAIEFAQQWKDFYTGGVYWFSGEDDTSFENSVNDLATRLGARSDSFGLTFSALLAMISRNKNPWLIVLDNMDQLNLSANIVKLVSGTWQHDASGHFLITTRRKSTALANDIREFDEKCCFSLGCFEIKEATKFLCRRIGVVSNEEIETDATKLIQKLGGLPLALEQAGAYIRSLGCTISQYLALYDSQRLRLLNRQKATRVSEYDSAERLAVRTTWHLNFEHIKQTADDGKAAIRFLHASAFLNPNEIQKDIINIGEPPVEDEKFSECVGTPLGRHQVLKLLTDFSLFKETLLSNLSVHHLVQEVIQENLNQEQQIQSIIDVIRLLHYAFQNCSSPDELLSTVTSKRDERPSMVSSGNLSRFYKWHKLCLHCYEMVKHLQKLIKQTDGHCAKVFQPETARIVYECAIHLSANSKHDEAKEVASFANHIFNLSEQQIPASSVLPHTIPLPELVRRHIQYCCNAPVTSKKDECGDSVEVPIDSVTSEQLEEMRMRGNDLFKKGCYSEALKIYSDAIDISKNTALFNVLLLSNRASVYLKLGQHNEALQDAEDYIMQRPKCWKGYARKALALVELKDVFGAYVAASLAYFYERNVFRNFKPFVEKLNLLGENLPLVCRNSSDLSAAYQTMFSVLFGQLTDRVKVIILEPGSYFFPVEGLIPSDITVLVQNLILVGAEAKCCSVSFLDEQDIHFGQNFIAHNVSFHCLLSDCHFRPDSVVKLTHCSFESSNHNCSSFCCKGKMKVDSCKFYNCTKGGLVVLGFAEIENSEFCGNGVAGLQVGEGGRLLVRKSKMYANEQGLRIDPQVKECVVEDCELYDNKSGGIIVANCVSGVTIRRNRIYDNDEPAVTIMRNSNASILQNEITGNSHWGIHIQENCQAVIKENKIHRNQCGGICVEVSSRKSVIERNDIFLNSGPGIYEKGSPNQCSDNNKLRDNKEGRNQSTAQSETKLCYYCKKSETNLEKCSNCFTAQYCGKTCKKNDWKNHKEVCDRLLSDGSIVVSYVRKPIMIGHLIPDNPFLKQTRGPGLLPVGPQYCRPPDKTSRFIVKMSVSVPVSGSVAKIWFDPTEVRLYDCSLTIDGILTDANEIYNLVWQHGAMGQLYSNSKKLFMWVKGPEDGKLRVFTNEFPPYQDW